MVICFLIVMYSSVWELKGVLNLVPLEFVVWSQLEKAQKVKSEPQIAFPIKSKFGGIVSLCGYKQTPLINNWFSISIFVLQVRKSSLFFYSLLAQRGYWRWDFFAARDRTRACSRVCSWVCFWQWLSSFCANLLSREGSLCTIALKSTTLFYSNVNVIISIL